MNGLLIEARGGLTRLAVGVAGVLAGATVAGSPRRREAEAQAGAPESLH